MDTKNKFISKRKLIAILVIVLAAIFLICGAFAVIPALFDDEVEPYSEPPRANYNFYEPDYDENIFEDEEYLLLIKNGIFEYDDGAVISMVDKNNAYQHGPALELVVDMLYSVVNGNVKEYNSYFSDRYFETREPKDKFTMQKIYDGRITYFALEVKSEDGKEYTEYTYKLKYRILENNGTFRDDIGDGYGVQHVTVTNRDGELKIESINHVIYK